MFLNGNEIKGTFFQIVLKAMIGCEIAVLTTVSFGFLKNIRVTGIVVADGGRMASAVVDGAGADEAAVGAVSAVTRRTRAALARTLRPHFIVIIIIKAVDSM